MNELKTDLTRTMSDPRHMSDEEIERRAGEILANHPPERDHELSDQGGRMSDRAVVQRARRIYERRQRDDEPTDTRKEK